MKSEEDRRGVEVEAEDEDEDDRRGTFIGDNE